ncbi:uncharacterized protein LOC17878047 [Capsella rubella]|nr:uncharacterized protein LOC17878047 [Capsella rubella]
MKTSNIKISDPSLLKIWFKVPPIHILHIHFLSSSFDPQFTSLPFSYLFSATSMAALDLKSQNDNKENIPPSNMATILAKPLDSSSSIDKEKTQIRIKRKRSRKPLRDITNLFVSSSTLSSSFTIRHVPSSPSLSLDPKWMKRRSGVVGLKAATSSSTFSCVNFR